MLYAAANRYFYGNRVKQLDVESLMEVERQKMHELLDQYRHVLLQEGVLFYMILLIATLVTYIKGVFTGIEFIVKFHACFEEQYQALFFCSWVQTLNF